MPVKIALTAVLMLQDRYSQGQEAEATMGSDYFFKNVSAVQLTSNR